MNTKVKCEFTIHQTSKNKDKIIKTLFNALDRISPANFIFDNVKGVLEIDNLYVPPKLRRQGKGSKQVKDIINIYAFDDWEDESRIGDSYVVFLTAGPSALEYDKEPSDEECIRLLKVLNEFYTRLNFLNIDFYHEQKYHAPYLYVGNPIGETLFKILQEDFEVGEVFGK